MTKNPLINALGATAYIVLIAGVMNYLTENASPIDNVMAPIMVLSMFTLSAAVMGYIFLYHPAQMFLDNKKKEAVDLFLKTVVLFGGITALIVTSYLSGIWG